MTPEQELQINQQTNEYHWLKDFREEFPASPFFNIYLAARKKAQVEIDTWERDYESINSKDQKRLDEIKKLKIEVQSLKDELESKTGFTTGFCASVCNNCGHDAGRS